jgi:integrase
MPRQQAKVVLTDRYIKSLEPKGKRYLTPDAIIPHFYISVTETGHKSFKVVRRPAGRQQVVWDTLGPYPELSLAAARNQARMALDELAQGRTRKEAEAESLREQEQAALAEQRQEAVSFAGVAEAFIADHLPRIKTQKRAERLIRQQFPRFGDRPITDIKRKDIIALIKEVKVNSGPQAARRTLGTVSKLFSWSLANDYIEFHPCSQIKITELVGEFTPRSRVLSDTEIRLVWHAAMDYGFPFGTVWRLLLLTGQRKSEIGKLSWSEVDLEKSILTLPTHRMKNAAAHVVPLTPKALQLVMELPRFKGRYLFSTNGGASGYSDAKVGLDRALAKLGHVAPFTIHDIRRSVRTALSSLKVQPVVAELVIGHAQQGIHAVYDLHRFEDEKREALARWEARLMQIVAG